MNATDFDFLYAGYIIALIAIGYGASIIQNYINGVLENKRKELEVELIQAETRKLEIEAQAAEMRKKKEFDKTEIID